MEAQTINSDTQKDLKISVIRWLAGRGDEIVSNPINGYVPVDAVIDAWQTGMEEGRKSAIDELRGQLISNIEKSIDATYELIALLTNKKIKINKLFISPAISNTKVILTVEDALFISDDFINIAFISASEIEDKYKKDNNVHLHFDFTSENPDLNIDCLKAEGYEISFDIAKNSPL